MFVPVASSSSSRISNPIMRTFPRIIMVNVGSNSIGKRPRMRNVLNFFRFGSRSLSSCRLFGTSQNRSHVNFLVNREKSAEFFGNAYKKFGDNENTNYIRVCLWFWTYLVQFLDRPYQSWLVYFRSRDCVGAALFEMSNPEKRSIRWIYTKYC